MSKLQFISGPKRPAMYDYFTGKARIIVITAQIEAQRLNHQVIETEHILLSLLKHKNSAHDAFKKFRLDPQRLMVEVQSISPPGPEFTATGALPHSPRVKNVIESAVQESFRLKQFYVGPEHLLLGLLREEDGMAAQVFQNLKLDITAVRSELLAILSLTTEAPAQFSDPPHSRVLSEPAQVALRLIEKLQPQELQVVISTILESM